MNLKRAKELVRKTGNLLDNVGTQVSPVERDLLLDYIRQLYESVLEPSQATAPTPPSPPAPPRPRAQIIDATPPPPPAPEPPRPAPVAQTPPPAPPRPAPTPRPQPQKPRIIEVPDSLKHLTPQTSQPVVNRPVTPPPPPAKPPQPRPQPTPPPPVPTPVATPEVPTAKREIPDSLNEVFRVEMGGDLADRLANAPIRDLTKAMGLNERMFTVNELFGGKKASFDEAMHTLNHLSSYEQAKVYLASNFALQHRWNSEDKLKKAQNFMKLVYRRYL